MPLGGDTARASVFATVFKAQGEKASGEVLSPSREFVSRSRGPETFCSKKPSKQTTCFAIRGPVLRHTNAHAGAALKQPKGLAAPTNAKKSDARRARGSFSAVTQSASKSRQRDAPAP